MSKTLLVCETPHGTFRRSTDHKYRWAAVWQRPGNRPDAKPYKPYVTWSETKEGAVKRVPKRDMPRLGVYPVEQCRAAFFITPREVNEKLQEMSKLADKEDWAEFERALGTQVADQTPRETKGL